MELSLRERKYASTKATLMDAVLSRLATQSLDEIAVKEVCAAVEVSETTFFNYFPTKRDVIIYFVQLWSIASSWAMQTCLQNGGSHLDAIRRLFDLTAEREESAPGIMGEIVTHQARTRDTVAFTPLTLAEYAYHFPQMPGIEQFEAQGVHQLLASQLAAARESQELPADIDLQALGMTLMAIFFVTPMLVQRGIGENLKAAYRRQLDQLLPD